MATYRTYAEILARVKHLVNFNEGVTDQDFIGPSTDANKHFRDAINEAYTDEVNEAVQHGAPETWLHAVQTISWPASQLTYTLPDEMKDRQFIHLEDVTSADPGSPIWVANRRENTEVFWLERNRLQWGTSGPSATKSLRFTYIQAPLELKNDDDEPTLILPDHRHILPWSAAIIMRDVGDEAAPQRWIQRRNELREKFWKALSLGQPMSTGYQSIQQTNTDYDIW